MHNQHMDLTDSQWQVIEKMVDNGGKRKISLKTVFSACLWLTRTGCQWRNLAPTYYPAWQTVAYYFYKWQQDGTWQQCLQRLVSLEREKQQRQPSPSRVAVDSQSVKQSGCFSNQVGVDGNKKIDGRKRHLAVDALGLPWARRIPHRVRWSAHVGAADEQDGLAGLELLPQLAKATNRLSLICADSAYKDSFVYYASFYKWQVAISQKPPSATGFIPQKGRWQVERSFGWLNHYSKVKQRL